MGRYIATDEQRAEIKAYLAQGYGIVVTDRLDGTLVPGYCDWQIEYVLDGLDALAKSTERQAASNLRAARNTRPT